MLKKKGYFFIIDAFIAMTILSVGMFILLSSYVTSPPKTQTIITSKDILDFMTRTTVKEMVIPDDIVNKTILYETGSLDNTIIEQVNEYRHLGKLDLAEDLTEYVLSTVVPVQFEILVNINGVKIYKRASSNIEDADILVPSKAHILTVYDQSQIFGPDLVEVFVWQ